MHAVEYVGEQQVSQLVDVSLVPLLTNWQKQSYG